MLLTTAPAAAARAEAKAGKLYRAPKDLVARLGEEGFDLDEIEEAELPEELRVLAPEARRGYLEAKSAERAEIAYELMRDVPGVLCPRPTGAFYLFPDMQPRLTVRKCQYCDAELPIVQELSSCPNCGGNFKTQVERVSLSKDDAYSMDE